jgi:hypothetical protein
MTASVFISSLPYRCSIPDLNPFPITTATRGIAVVLLWHVPDPELVESLSV